MTQPGPESPTRNAVFALASQFAGAAFTAVITLALVRLLEPEGYGIYALALGLGVVMLPLLDLGVSISSTRFFAEHHDDPTAVRAVLASALRLKLVISIVVGLALFALAGPIAQGYDEPDLKWAVRAVAVSVVAQSFFLQLVGVYTALGRISLSLRMVLVESSLEAAVAIGLVVAGAGAVGALCGRALGYLAAVAAGFALLSKVVGRRRSAARDRADSVAPGWQRIAGYAMPLVAVEIVSVAFGQLGVLMIGGYLGATAAGLFEAPLRLSIFLQQAGLALAAGFTPRLARAGDRGIEGPRFERALRAAVLMYGATIAPLVVWAGPIVELLLGPEYSASEDVLRTLAAFTFLAGPGLLVAIAPNYLGQAARRVPIAIGALAISAVVTILLVPEIGIVGGAIASAAGYLLYIPAQYWICRRLLGLRTAPLLLSVTRALAAAGAMAAVLFAFGTESLNALEWIAGGLLGVAAYLGVLLAMRELSPDELREGAAVIRSRLRGDGLS